jgi:hypothetical protein
VRALQRAVSGGSGKGAVRTGKRISGYAES